MARYPSAMQQRTTQQQEAIRQAIERAKRPLSPAEIHRAAMRAVPSLSLATVYRTLKRLMDERQLHAVELPGEPPRYETAEAAHHHHHHFHCNRCDKVYDIEGCAHDIDEMAPKGFSVTDHQITLYGLCAACTPVA